MIVLVLVVIGSLILFRFGSYNHDDHEEKEPFGQLATMAEPPGHFTVPVIYEGTRYTGKEFNAIYKDLLDRRIIPLFSLDKSAPVTVNGEVLYEIKAQRPVHGTPVP